MKAVLVREFGAPSSHRVEELPGPVPGPREVRVAVRAAAVNFPDLLVMAGSYQILPPRPFVPGKDAAGVVSALGPEFTEFTVGERVAVHLEHGAYASEVTAPVHQMHGISDAISFVDAAAMGLAWQTAYFALVDRGGFRAGETVLVNGAAGGVGQAAILRTGMANQALLQGPESVVGRVLEAARGKVIRGVATEAAIAIEADSVHRRHVHVHHTAESPEWRNYRANSAPVVRPFVVHQVLVPQRHHQTVVLHRRPALGSEDFRRRELAASHTTLGWREALAVVKQRAAPGGFDRDRVKVLGWLHHVKAAARKLQVHVVQCKVREPDHWLPLEVNHVRSAGVVLQPQASLIEPQSNLAHPSILLPTSS